MVAPLIKLHKKYNLYISIALLALFAFNKHLNIYSKYLLVFAIILHITYLMTGKYDHALRIAFGLTLVMLVFKRVFRRNMIFEGMENKDESDNKDDNDDNNNGGDNDNDDSDDDDNKESTVSDDDSDDDSEDDTKASEKFKQYRKLNKETLNMADALKTFQQTIHGLAPTIKRGEKIMKSLEKLI